MMTSHGYAARQVIRGLLLTAGVVVSGCGRETESSSTGQDRTELSGRLVVTGSSTVAPLAVEIGKRFEWLHPGVRIDIQSGGSSRGIADVSAGRADIGMASRELLPTETGLEVHPLARDGIGLIVHEDNPVDELTTDQVVSIFTSNTMNWQQVGGLDLPLVVTSKAEGRGTREAFHAHFRIDAAKAREDVIVGGNQQAIKTVAGNPMAIGYVSIGSAVAEIAAGAAIKLLSLDGHPATQADVAAGTYPMTRSLLWVTRPEPGPLVRKFLAFARSAEVDALIETQHFVPLRR